MTPVGAGTHWAPAPRARVDRGGDAVRRALDERAPADLDPRVHAHPVARPGAHRATVLVETSSEVAVRLRHEITSGKNDNHSQAEWEGNTPHGAGPVFMDSEDWHTWADLHLTDQPLPTDPWSQP